MDTGASTCHCRLEGESGGSSIAAVSDVDHPEVIFGVEIDGHLEMRPSKLVRRYLRSWFCIDLMVVSIDATLMILESLQARAPAPAKSARYLRTLRLLRLLRLLRVAKLQRELTKLANNFLSTYAFMVMRVVSGLLMILAVNHVIACCWFGLGRWTLEDGSSWLVNAGIADSGFADSYATSIHWALTQFTPATNNVAPVNFVERLLASQANCSVFGESPWQMSSGLQLRCTGQEGGAEPGGASTSV